MIQSFYDAVDDALNFHGAINILERLLLCQPQVAPNGLNRELISNFPLAFTYFRLLSAEKGNWHDRYEQDRWVSLPEAYALTKEDVVKVNFQTEGRLFVPVKTNPLSLSKNDGFAGQIFGFGYTLREIESDLPDIGLTIKGRHPANQHIIEYQWEGEPIIELTLEIRNGIHFWDRKKNSKMPHTFLGITASKLSERLYQGRDPTELFYRTLRDEYKAHLSSLLNQEKKKLDELTKKSERIED